mgnify:FL=1
MVYRSRIPVSDSLMECPTVENISTVGHVDRGPLTGYLVRYNIAVASIRIKPCFS